MEKSGEAAEVPQEEAAVVLLEVNQEATAVVHSAALGEDLTAAAVAHQAVNQEVTAAAHSAASEEASMEVAVVEKPLLLPRQSVVLAVVEEFLALEQYPGAPPW